MPRMETPRIVWTVATYGSDWRGSDFVARFASAVAGCGVLGRVTELKLGYDQDPVPVPPHTEAEVPELLSKQFWARTGIRYLEARGTAPHPWKLWGSFMPSPPEARSIGELAVVFDYPAGEPDPSSRLWAAFRGLSRAQDCRVAFIHPWHRWQADRQRRPPLVTAATFESVLWATFLSADELKLFDVEALSLEAHTVEWLPDGSLFLRLSESLRDLYDKEASKPIEKQRVALIKRFEAATGKRKRIVPPPR